MLSLLLVLDDMKGKPLAIGNWQLAKPKQQQNP
jgi:hypothetical protein